MTFTQEQITVAITQCQAGSDFDRHFLTIHDCYYRQILGFFRGRQDLTEADCEELTQEVLIHVYRNIERFRHESRFGTWLWAINMNVLRDHWRKQGAAFRSGNANTVSIESFNEETEQLALEIADLAPNALDRLVDGELLTNLREAINSLPRQMRNCMRHRVQGRTYQEIADLMGLDRGAVSKHLFDARDRIKTYLKERYAG